MKTNLRRGPAAFTLIELMAVITIMVLLAGLVIGGMGFVTERQAKEKAKVQINLMCTALEEYKLDNGSYPPTGDGDGKDNSKILFKALYLDGKEDTTGAKKIYISQLDPLNNKQGWTSGTATTIVDPWGNEYRYRSADPLTPTIPPTKNASTQNPDFDLWSVGKDGQTLPGTPSDKKNRDDIKNF